MVEDQSTHLELLASSAIGDERNLAQLLKKEMNIEFKDELGRTALMVATINNKIGTVQLLLDHGSDPNARDINRLTPFICASANGFHEITRCMVSAGADLMSTNRFGGTALLPAAEKGYINTVKVCLNAGVPVNHMNDLGWSALLEAVILGNGGRLYADVIRQLVTAGADIYLTDREGKSALQHAQELNQDRIIPILLGKNREYDPYINAINAFVQERSYNAAIAEMDKALATDDKNLDYYYLKGYIQEEKKDYYGALREFRKALAINPENLEFYFYTANSYRSMGLPEEALKEYDKAIKLKPKETFYRYHKSNYLRELGRHEEAVREMNELLDLRPDRYDFAFHKANSLRSLEKHAEAIETIEIAINSDPGNPLYHDHKQQSEKLLHDNQG